MALLLAPILPVSRAGDEDSISLTLENIFGRDSQDKPWHIEAGFRDSCTKLEETEKILERRLDRLLRFDTLQLFDKPRTPLDRRSEFLLTSLYLGVGRQESDWLIWTFYVGGGMGQDHEHQRVFNNNLEVTFKYAYVYTGLTAELYPWRVPHRADFEHWTQRLAASRPFLTTGMETGYVSAEGRGSWLVRGNASECRLDFDVTTDDVRALMDAMQLGTQVQGKEGVVSARLSWPGPPEVSALERLSGRLEISAKMASSVCRLT